MPRRTSRGPVHQIIFRLPLAKYAEVITFNPSLVAADGTARYGAMQNYLLKLVEQDLERKKKLVREGTSLETANDES